MMKRMLYVKKLNIIKKIGVKGIFLKHQEKAQGLQPMRNTNQFMNLVQLGPRSQAKKKPFTQPMESVWLKHQKIPNLDSKGPPLMSKYFRPGPSY